MARRLHPDEAFRLCRERHFRNQERGHGQRRAKRLGRGGGGGGGSTDGAAPDGSRLYNAQWYREPRDAELQGYMRPGQNVRGWAMISCRTVANYHVEDCQELDESPAGSGMARVLRQASWQFLVRPPRVNGTPLVGAWVRIRFDFIRRKEATAQPRENEAGRFWRSGVDQVAVEVARAVLDELEAVFGVAAHQAVDQILDRRPAFVFGGRVMRKRLRVAGAIVVSRNWPGFISPRPLKRPTSTFLPLNLVASSSARCASSRA
jgi:hypothetical protein